MNAAQLRELVKSGTVLSSDLIWKDGMSDWRPAGEVKGLFPEDSSVGAESAPADQADSSSRPAALQIPALVAAVALMVAFFVPWWGFTIEGNPDDFAEELDIDSRKNRNRAERNIRALAVDAGWYMRNLPQCKIDIGPLRQGDDIRISGKIWGWDSRIGLAAFLLGMTVFPIGIVMMVSRSLRRWSWIPSLIAAYVGLALLIVTFVWYLNCPGQEIGKLISQSVIVGPYLVSVGSMILIGGGLIDGILGLRAFRSAGNLTS